MSDIHLPTLVKKSDYLIRFTIKEVKFEKTKGYVGYKLCNIKQLIKFPHTNQDLSPLTDNKGCVDVEPNKLKQYNNFQLPPGEYISFCKILTDNPKKINYSIQRSKKLFHMYKDDEEEFIFDASIRPIMGLNLRGYMHLGIPSTKSYGKASIKTKNLLQKGLTVNEFIYEMNKLIRRKREHNPPLSPPGGIKF